jgi:hypothetical protein
MSFGQLVVAAPVNAMTSVGLGSILDSLRLISVEQISGSMKTRHDARNLQRYGIGAVR